MNSVLFCKTFFEESNLKIKKYYLILEEIDDAFWVSLYIGSAGHWMMIEL